jgi:hypothetical protein
MVEIRFHVEDLSENLDKLLQWAFEQKLLVLVREGSPDLIVIDLETFIIQKGQTNRDLVGPVKIDEARYRLDELLRKAEEKQVIIKGEAGSVLLYNRDKFENMPDRLSFEIDGSTDEGQTDRD